MSEKQNLNIFEEICPFVNIPDLTLVELVEESRGAEIASYLKHQIEECELLLSAQHIVDTADEWHKKVNLSGTLKTGNIKEDKDAN